MSKNIVRELRDSLKPVNEAEIHGHISLRGFNNFKGKRIYKLSLFSYEGLMAPSSVPRAVKLNKSLLSRLLEKLGMKVEHSIMEQFITSHKDNLCIVWDGEVSIPWEPKVTDASRLDDLEKGLAAFTKPMGYSHEFRR